MLSVYDNQWLLTCNWMRALSKYEQLEMTIPIQRTYNYDYIYFMFNNMAVVETKANISNIWLIHGLIAIEYFISFDN